jgi:F-type H+-transporting ATPase subunit delta
MSARLVARRYAKAFVEIGVKQGQLHQLQGELSRVAELVRETPDLRRVVENPIFAPKQKSLVFDQLLAALGATATLRQFLKVVAEGARMNLLFDIEAAVRDLVDQRAGIMDAHVASAQPLSETQNEALIRTLGARTGKTIRVRWKHDPALLGGLRVQVGSTVFDASLQGQLRLLKAQLLSA